MTSVLRPALYFVRAVLCLPGLENAVIAPARFYLLFRVRVRVHLQFALPALTAASCTALRQTPEQDRHGLAVFGQKVFKVFPEREFVLDILALFQRLDFLLKFGKPFLLGLGSVVYPW